MDCRGEGAGEGLEPAQVIGVLAHALQVEVYANLAPGGGGVENRVTFCMSSPELAEAGGVCLPFVDLPCMLQGLPRLQFLERRGSAIVGFLFFAWGSALWGRWFCHAKSYLGGQGHTHGCV